MRRRTLEVTDRLDRLLARLDHERTVLRCSATTRRGPTHLEDGLRQRLTGDDDQADLVRDSLERDASLVGLGAEDLRVVLRTELAADLDLAAEDVDESRPVRRQLLKDGSAGLGELDVVLHRLSRAKSGGRTYSQPTLVLSGDVSRPSAALPWALPETTVISTPSDGCALGRSAAVMS